MKLLLLQHVRGTGQKGEIITASDGYAANFLIPRGLAKPLTEAVEQELAAQSAEDAAQQKAIKNTAEKLKKALTGQKVAIEVPAQGEKLFGALHEEEIAQAINTQLGVSVTKDMLQLKHAIKTVATHTITIACGAGTTVDIAVNVIAKA